MHPITPMKLNNLWHLTRSGLPIAIVALAAISMAACTGVSSGDAAPPTLAQVATQTATPAGTPTPTHEPTPTPEPSLTPTPAPYMMPIADVPDTFEVSYVAWENVTIEMVLSGTPPPMSTAVVPVNKDRLMPVPLGVVREGMFDSVDATIAMMKKTFHYTFQPGATPDLSTIDVGVLSGIFVHSHHNGPNTAESIYIAFAARDGSWVIVYGSVVGDMALVPVDTEMVSTDPVGQFFLLEPHIYVQQDRIEAKPAIKPGDHVLFFFLDGETSHGCNDLPASQAIQFVIEGGKCIRQPGAIRPGEPGSLSAYGKAFMYLSMP